jgi:hypothetical protein
VRENLRFWLTLIDWVVFSADTNLEANFLVHRSETAPLFNSAGNIMHGEKTLPVFYKLSLL